MKLDKTIDVGHICTLIALIAAVIVWGIRLEGRIDGYERVQDVRWEENYRRLDRIRDDMRYLDKQLEEQEDRPCPLQLLP